MPSLDRQRRRNVLQTMVSPQRRPTGSRGPIPPALGERINGVEAQRRALPGPGQATHNVSAGNLSDYKKVKAAGGDTRQNGKQIGFYNATHKHGEQMKGLIAKLKKQRTQGPQQGPAAAVGNIPPGATPTKPTDGTGTTQRRRKPRNAATISSSQYPR